MNERPTKRSLAKAETRARLIAAAQDHLQGHASLPTVAEIVKAAGVSSGTFYLHFPSMQQLVAELQDDLQRQLAGSIDEEAGLAAGIQAYVEHAEKNELAVRALWPVPDRNVDHPPSGKDLLRTWLTTHLSPTVPYGANELDAIAELLATMIQAATVQHVLADPEDDEGDFAASCLAVLEHVQDALGGAARRNGAPGEDHGSRIVLICGDRRFTGAELDARVARAVTLLQDAGIGASDRLGMLLHNGPAAVEINVAAQLLGAGVVPLNTYWRTREIEHVVRQSHMRGLVFHDEFRSLLESIDPDLRRSLVLVPVGSSTAEERYERQLRNLRPTTVDNPPQSATLSYTSGSTGMPKGIFRAESASERRRHGLFLASLFDITGADRLVISGPLHHAANRLFANVCRQVGATMIVLDHFDAERLLRVIDQEQATVALVVPTMLYRLVKLDPEVRERYDLSSLRAIAHMGSPCSIELKQQAMRVFGPIVHEYYGTTEMGGTVIPPHEWIEHPGSVGRSWRSDTLVRILGDDDHELPPEAVGRVALLDPRRAPFQYLDENGEPQGSPLNADGLFVTDDLGHLDAEGYLYLADRRSAVFKTGGVAVYPAEVEAVIAADPSVADCAVSGEPDPEWGHTVVAFVQPLPGHQVDIDRLRSTVRAQLAHYKCPRRWVVVDEIPRDGAGKLMRSELPKPLEDDPDRVSPAAATPSR